MPRPAAGGGAILLLFLRRLLPHLLLITGRASATVDRGLVAPPPGSEAIDGITAGASHQAAAKRPAARRGHAERRTRPAAPP